ncbi:hypothetical protein ASH00_16175 [Arthrobacter sp. Soil782]|uniref:hypothetical protein n=1 Tax=Arthrobacter sp. Soil782 TaxID=1736410 RepID=UPI0006FCE139|nr:hypothetical protein [Arthrobacter sp. Soil782]KRF07080.1 hypothetical protein ASH00_16175 [Arthrobacter sp. Soil782]
MSTQNRSRTTASIANAVLVGILLLGAAVIAFTGHWVEAGLLGVLALVVLAAAAYARHLQPEDVARVNAMKYQDERDRHLGQVGFAAVGVAALALSAVEFLAVTLFVDGLQWSRTAQLIAAGQLVLLCLVWAVANSTAARRQ